MLLLKRLSHPPPQFGFIYLGKGWYVTSDPLGEIVILPLSRLHRWVCRVRKRSPNELHRWWDGVYRCKWRVPYAIDRWQSDKYWFIDGWTREKQRRGDSKYTFDAANNKENT